MGKHTAPDDSGVHPLVAEALVRRAGAPVAAHGETPHAETPHAEHPDGEDQDGEHQSGSIGWPEPPPGGGGAVGWPDDMQPGQGGTNQGFGDGEAHPDAASADAAPVRGWRRLFTANRAA